MKITGKRRRSAKSGKAELGIYQERLGVIFAFPVEGVRSDQGEVWESIGEPHASHRTSSGTGAMKDAYEARRADLTSYLETFPSLGIGCGERQKS